MSARAHEDAVEVLSRWPAPSMEQESLRKEYLDHLATHPDGQLRQCYPHHLTAGVLILRADASEVLLNLHRKAGRWFAFGGHLEREDTSLAGAALREGREESGLTGLVLDEQPVHLSRHEVGFCDPRGLVDHLDVRFLARVGTRTDAAVEPRVSDESLDVRWWSLDALPTDEPDMLALIELARSRVLGRG